MNYIELILMMLIGGLIGWTTNKVAIKMLFRPVKPIKILFWTLHGVLPKRQTEIADSIGETIEGDLLSKNEIIENLITEDAKTEIKAYLTAALTNKITEIIPAMFLSMLGGNIHQTVEQFVHKEGDKLLYDLVDHINNDSNSLNIKDMISNKIKALDFSEFEDMVYRIMKKELSHIEQVGLFLGLFIGATQYVITLFV